MHRKLTAGIISSSLIASLFLGAFSLPALAFARENEHGKKNGLNVSANVRVGTHAGKGNAQGDEEDNNNEDRGNGEHDRAAGSSTMITLLSASTTPGPNGSWFLHIEALLTGGAGKSGKVPPGLLHAPGIWRKFLGIFHVGSTTPDITAPTITSMNASGITTNSATINWTTSKRSRGTVYVSTTSPVAVASSTMHVDDTSLLFAHHDIVSGLSASTTYVVKIVATDSSGNATTSSEFSFTTGATPDTTPPVISAVSVGGVTNTSAQISWTTNEAATGKVYYSTSTPVIIGGAQTTLVSTSSLSTSHSFTLSGLTASTTYHFFVSSTDASSNAANSSEGSFTTGI